jgi:hypothetical protein
MWLVLMASCVLNSTVEAGPAPALEVHEWGTFTVVAGQQGTLLDWTPLSGPSDLPPFVYQQGASLRGDCHYKGCTAQVRMETPVLYFYTDTEMTVDVQVGFPEGHITEWYPQASAVDGGIDWGQVRLLAADHPAVLPTHHLDSHYYPARAVPDAALVQSCGERTEVERFLFYRGIGDFQPSITAALDQGVLTLDQVPGRALVFEAKGDRVGWTWVSGDHAQVPRPELNGELPVLFEELRSMLQDEGLTADEAASMVATWEDDWFEPGLRVMAVLPDAEVDARLPLTITPAPDRIERVLMARVEVLTPEQLDVAAAILDAHPGDDAALAALDAALGRFGGPALSQLDSERAQRLGSPQGAGNP